MQNQVHGLDIHLCSFELDKKIHNRDDINVSVSIIPDGKIQYFYIDGNNFRNNQHSFTVNITDKTEKIVMLFKKKNVLLDDSYIGYAYIGKNDFQKSKNSEIQSIPIYNRHLNRRFRKQHKNQNQFDKDISGHINVQFSIMEPFPERKNNGKKLNFEK